MGRKNLLETAVPRIRQHMAEKESFLTLGEAAELLGVSSSTASGVLAYMEATGIVDHVRRFRNYYFLRGAYDEERLSEVLLGVGAELPPMTMRCSRKPQKSKYDLILDRFLDGGHGLVEVTVEGKSAYSVNQALDRRIKAKGLVGQVESSVVDKRVYLEKV